MSDKNDTVYVVTGLDLGWNCVVGVYSGVTLKELQKRFPKGEYVISDMRIETEIEED